MSRPFESNGLRKRRRVSAPVEQVVLHLAIVRIIRMIDDHSKSRLFYSGYRLFSSAVYNDSFPEYTPPEIVRKPVEDLVLQLKTLNIDRLANFPFPTPPDLKAIQVAENILVQLNALDGSTPTKKITDLGRRMAAYPVNPRYSKMLVIAQENQGLLPLVVALVAALSVTEVLNSGHVMIKQVFDDY